MATIKCHQVRQSCNRHNEIITKRGHAIGHVPTHMQWRRVAFGEQFNKTCMKWAQSEVENTDIEMVDGISSYWQIDIRIRPELVGRTDLVYSILWLQRQGYRLEGRQLVGAKWVDKQPTDGGLANRWINETVEPSQAGTIHSWAVMMGMRAKGSMAAKENCDDGTISYTWRCHYVNFMHVLKYLYLIFFVFFIFFDCPCTAYVYKVRGLP